MGCNVSKPAYRTSKHSRRKSYTAADVRGPLNNALIQIPLTKFNDEGRPIARTRCELDAQTLIKALRLLSRYIEQQGRSLTVIAIGGSVNVLYLESRTKTYDIDIIGSHLLYTDRMLLDKAMNFTIENSETPLGSDWFNTKAQVYMGMELHRDLTKQAEKTNDIIYQDNGIKVLAAPFEYAFSAKISRLLGDRPRAYDLEDALAYLDVLVDRNGGNPLIVDAFVTLAGWYRHDTNEEFLREEVGPAYRERFRREPWF